MAAFPLLAPPGDVSIVSSRRLTDCAAVIKIPTAIRTAAERAKYGVLSSGRDYVAARDDRESAPRMTNAKLGLTYAPFWEHYCEVCAAIVTFPNLMTIKTRAIWLTFVSIRRGINGAIENPVPVPSGMVAVQFIWS